MHRFFAAALLSTSLLAGCQGPTGPGRTDDQAEPLALKVDPGLTASASGKGSASIGADIPVQLAFFANSYDQRPTHGELSFRTQLGGLPIDFEGRVTCLAVDDVNHRAWIGGVILKNRSTHPSFTTPIHAVGKDIWFRVVDYGRGVTPVADRTTFVGFEGGGGILTSAEYCAARIWPDTPPDARTQPLLTGNITVRVPKPDVR